MGFSRKAEAPNLVASTAVSMVPWPLIMITGIVSCAAAPFLEQRDAVDVGHPDVQQHEVGLEQRSRTARACAAFSASSTVCPSSVRISDSRPGCRARRPLQEWLPWGFWACVTV
jgi:hypothetical protein